MQLVLGRSAGERTVLVLARHPVIAACTAYEDGKPVLRHGFRVGATLNRESSPRPLSPKTEIQLKS